MTDDADAVARCPRCLSLDHMERLRTRDARRWWCAHCNLVCAGTAAEHRAEAAAQPEPRKDIDR